MSDIVISLTQVGANYPALLWMRRFLARRALARPAEPLPADLKPQLVSLGLSAREADVVELLLAGLSHKEIGGAEPAEAKSRTFVGAGRQPRVRAARLSKRRIDVLYRTSTEGPLPTRTR